MENKYRVSAKLKKEEYDMLMTLKDNGFNMSDIIRRGIHKELKSLIHMEE